jgi:hypothetical protein
MLFEIKNKKLVHETVSSFIKSISNTHLRLPPDVAKFVFLCGANKNLTEISERRKALIEFSRANLPNTHFFLAERMFLTLKAENHDGNILDVEHLISSFSDHILIILESPSSFAELGAFSHSTLREKLVVINSSEFKNQESFINLGPIKAIEEKSGTDKIIYYKMKNDGIHRRDGIGSVFNEVYELFKDPVKTSKSHLKLEDLNPALRCDKQSAMFIHDLIYLTGPILHREFIELLKLFFGKQNYNNATHLLAILSSFESIERDGRGLYRSKMGKTYYDYKFDTSKFISTFRNYTLKNYPERLYAY